MGTGKAPGACPLQAAQNSPVRAYWQTALRGPKAPRQSSQLFELFCFFML